MVDVSRYTNTLPYGKHGSKKGLAYREEEGRLLALFEHDLAEENGMLDNPKRYLLWAKAWEQGHASGLSDVEYWYEDLLELVA